MRLGRIISGLVVIAALGGGAWAWRAFSPRQAPPRIPTARISRGAFVVSLQVDGTLQSDDAVNVKNGDATGKLTQIVRDGAVVKEGDVFCRLDASDLEQREAETKLRYQQAQEEIERTREGAQQEYENAKRAVERAEQDLQSYQESNRVGIQQKQDKLDFDRAEEERARIEYDRKKRLAEKGYASGTEAEVARADYEAKRFGVEQSTADVELERRKIASELRRKQTSVEAAKQKAEVSQRRIDEQVKHAQERSEMAGKELEKIRTSLAQTVVRAPVSGIVTLYSYYGGGQPRPPQAGDQVWGGMGLGTISGTAHMSVFCRVKETNVASVWKGQQTEVQFEALPDRLFKGTVSTVSAVGREVHFWEDPKADPNVRVFEVWVKVDQKQAGRLKPGLNAKVAFIVKRVPHALYLPLDAVFERAGKSLVYVKQGERFLPRQVRVGDRNDEAVVVRSGLGARDVVAMVDPTRYTPPRAEKAQ